MIMRQNGSSIGAKFCLKTNASPGMYDKGTSALSLSIVVQVEIGNPVGYLSSSHLTFTLANQTFYDEKCKKATEISDFLS